MTFSLVSCQTPKPPVLNQKIAIGTYTKKEGHVDGKGDGIYLGLINMENGQIVIEDTIKGIVNPSYVQIKDQTLYAVSELADASIQTIGEFHRIDLKTKSKETILIGGDAPCHVNLISEAGYAVVTNYVNSISLVNIAQGLKTVDIISPEGYTQGPPRQESSHPHMSHIAPDGNTLLVSDLGLDAIIHYDYKSGKLVEIGRTATMPRSGPRHMATDEKNGIVYVLNELNHTIESFQWMSDSVSMKRLSISSTLDEGITDENVNCSAIKIHPSRKFLYSANRGINQHSEQSITAFKIEEPGRLIKIGKYSTKGLIPRDFSITPDGTYLVVANQDSDNIITFLINADGSLKDARHELMVNTPVCIKFYE